MRSFWSLAKLVITCTPIASFLISCNNLSVFVPPMTASNFDKLSNVEVNSNGLLQLTWQTKSKNDGSSFEIYQMQVEADDPLYHFSDAAIENPPLTSETINVGSSKNTPKIKGKLLATVKDLSFTFTNLLEAGPIYAVQILEKGKKISSNQQNILLVKVGFKEISAATAQLSDNSVTIDWNAVSGANLYKIYADSAMSVLLGETAATSITLSAKSGQTFKDFYVRAFRGAMAAVDITKVKLEQSDVQVAKVKAITANGLYKQGDILDFQVVFSKAVTAFGELALPLKIGSQSRNARYRSGSGSDNLLFRYQIQAGDNTEKLANGNVLLGSYVDGAGLEVGGDLPLEGKLLTLQESSLIAIDTEKPTAPSLVAFDSVASSNGALSAQWISGSDLHFDKDEIKLCASSSCDTSCSAASPVLTSAKTFSGVADGVYYACVRSLDTVGNATDWAVSLPPATVDSVPPSIVRVYSSTSNGSFKEGQSISITMELSEIVTVTAGGDINLLLETGGTDHNASYVSGSGSRYLVFTYLIQAGDNSAALNYHSINALSLGASGSIRDGVGLQANVTLPALNSGLSLAGQSSLIVDTLVPSNPSGVSFTTSSPAPTLNLGVSWTASSDANFKQHHAKLCSSNDCSTSCLSSVATSSSSLTLSGSNGSSYYACVQGEDTTGHMSAWVASSSAVSINATLPSVVEVRSTTVDAVYKEGDSLAFSVLFSDAVRVTGGAGIKITLATGSTNHQMSYSSGDNSNTLVFSYIVQAGDTSADLNYLDSNALTLGGGTVKSLSGNDADLTLPALAGPNSLASLSQIVLDTSNPSSPSSVIFTGSSPSSSTSVGISWAASSDANFKYHNIKLCSDSACTTACVSPSTSVASPATLSGSDGSSYYACVQGEDQVGHLSSWIASSSVLAIDTTAPSIVNVTSSDANGYYSAGSSLSIALRFSEVVTVSSGANLAVQLETGTVDRFATYVSGSGSDTLIFSYTVQAGDTSADLDYTGASALSLISGTVKDAAGNDALLTLPALPSAVSIAGQKAIVIDTTAPSNPSSIGFGSSISNTSSVSMSWSDSTDNNFQTHNVKLCSSNDCSTGCVSVGTALNSPTSIIGFNGNTYYGCVQGKDQVGLTSAWVSSLGTVTIDSNQPLVTNVSSTQSDGVYKAGVTIPISVEFNKAVYVTGSVSLGLLLETGSVDQTASYVSGSGTNILLFHYLVQAGDTTSDLEYQGLSALSVGAGSIKDLANNDAVLQLPVLHSANSLAGQKAIVIDTTAPSAPVISTPTNNSYAASNITIVSGTAEANAAIDLKDGGSPIATTTASAGGAWSITLSTALTDGSHSLTATATDAAGNISTISTANVAVVDTIAPVDPSAIVFALPTSNALTFSMSWSNSTDPNLSTHNVKICTANDCSTACTSVSTSLSTPATMTGVNGSTYYGCVQGLDKAGNLSAWKSSVSSITVDTTAPTVLNVISTQANASYKATAVIPVSVKFSENVYVLSGASLGLLMETGATDRTAVYSSGSGTDTLIFNYTVQAGDTSSDLEYNSTTALTVGAGSIKDNAGNDATLTLPALNSANSLAGQKAIVIDTTAPVAPVIDIPTSNSYAASNITIVSGTAEANAAIDLKDGGSSIATTTASAGGAWSVTLGSALINGIHNLTATATDIAGNVSVASSTVIATVDTIVPTDASSVGFASPTSNALTFSMSWSNSTDTNLSTHNVKICTANDCSTACTSVSTSLNTPATMTGVNGSTYYGCVQGLDKAGNLSAWKSSVSSITVDTTAPTVLNVSSTQANASYKATAVIPVSVKFSENVYVLSGASLGLLMETGATDRTAVYSSGSGTDTLIFNYTVQAGDTSSDLEYNSTTALTVGAGSIKDNAGNDATLTLPALNSANSLAGQKAIVIDTTAPAAPVFTSPTHGSTVTSPIASISGSSEASAAIEVYESGVSIGTTTANGSGNWTLTLGSSYMNGTYSFTAVARDAALNQSSTGSALVTVAVPAPTANAGSDIIANAAVTLVGSATNAVSYQWTKVSGPGTVTFGSGTALTTTVSVSADGDYTLRLTATNAASVSVSDDMVLTRDATAPTFGGVTNVWQKSGTDVLLYWNAATDNLTQSSDIVYEICVSASLGSCASNFVVSYTAAANAWEYKVSGLTAGTAYDFLVRAKDFAGNVSNGSGAKQSAGLTNIKQLASGDTHVCALLNDTNKTVKCLGFNSSGQLGNGLTANSATPVIVSGLTQVSSLGLGANHSCAVLTDGTVKCWGRNSKGQLGNNSTTNSSTPVVVSALSGVTSVSAGDEYTCALLSTGEVKCWGYNATGQLGDGTNVDKLTPVSVSGTVASPVSMIDLGMKHACAKFNNGDFKCWGYNNDGAVGDGTSGNNRSTPTTIASLANQVSTFSAGGISTCAVLTSGAVKCWGRNYYGQVGDGTTIDRSSPTTTSISSGAVTISIGYEFVCALMSGGDVKCWGVNGNGQLGVGNTSNSSAPLSVFGLSGVSDFTAGNAHACALLSDKTARCWGANGAGQLGSASASVVAGRYTPSKSASLSNVVSVGEGNDYACALISDGTVQCWGNGNNGQFGNSTYNNYVVNSPVTVSGISTAVSLGVGRYHSCSVLGDGSVKCWGKNDKGQLGDGATSTNRLTPVTVSGLSGATSVSANASQSCALLSDATVRCWGSNVYGQLGDGTTTDRLAPVDPGLSNVKKISVGDTHSCALLNDASKTVKCWGANDYGQLGDGTTTFSSSPVSTLTDAIDLSVGFKQSCAVLTGGSVKCWGFNNQGQLGNGNTTTSLTPVVALSSGASTVSTGIDNSCALLSSGAVKCWGSNSGGILGNATSYGSYVTSPVDVTGLNSVSYLSSGGYLNCAILTSNKLRCWGQNSKNQLGLDPGVFTPYIPSQIIPKGEE